MKSILKLFAIISLALPIQVYADVQAANCDGISYNESSQSLQLEVQLQQLNLSGTVQATLSPIRSSAGLRVEIEDNDGSTLLSSIEAGDQPEVLHVQKVIHQDGQLAMTPIIEIFFESGFVAVQLRDFIRRERFVFIAIATAPNSYSIDCPQLGWSAVDFAATKKMNLNLDEALASFIAYKRSEIHQLNLDKATLELSGEELTDSLNLSLERESSLQNQIEQLSAQLQSQMDQFEQLREELGIRASTVKKALRQSEESRDSRLLKAVQKILRKIKTLFE